MTACAVPQVAGWPDWDARLFQRTEFDALLRWCHLQGASDVLLKSGDHAAMIVNDALVDVTPTTVPREALFGVLREIHSASVTSTVLAGEPADFAYLVEADDGRAIRFRCNATAVKGIFGASAEIALTLRAIPDLPPTVDDIALPDAVVAACDARHGLVLVSGPTGSGKSTTLAALIRRLAESQRRNILTYEAPVEFDFSRLPGRQSRVSQTEVPSQIPSFAEAVRNSLRRAPDVIMVGEARDAATISSSVRAATTGHLVLTTVHANDVAGVIPRMLDEFPPDERQGAAARLVGTVRCMVQQYLYPAADGGRIALREYLCIDNDLRRELEACLFQGEGALVDLLRRAVPERGQCLVADAVAKRDAGLITPDTFRLVCLDAGVDPAVAARPSEELRHA